jgi:hypothetical protein
LDMFSYLTSNTRWNSTENKYIGEFSGSHGNEY